MKNAFIHKIHWIPPDDGNVTAASLILATVLVALAAMVYTVFFLRGLSGRLKAGSGAGTPFRIYANIVGIRLKNFSSFGETLRRFPLPIAAFVLFAFLFSQKLIENVQQKLGQFDLLSRVPEQTLGLIALTAAFWFLAVKLWQESEKRPWPVATALAVSGFAFIFWCIYETPYTWHTLVPATVLLVTVAPFLRSGANSFYFWDFNRSLWSSVPISLVAAGVFVAFILLVFLPLGHLIGTNWFRSYFAPWVFVVIALVASVVTLGGIPKTFRSKSGEISLLLFLLALALVLIAVSFLAFFYLYLGSIVFREEWLLGNTGMVVLHGATLGVVAYLMAFPLRQDNALFRVYYRVFFPALILPLGLLCIALATRVDAYGITENRYLVGLLCFWLTASAIAFIAFKPPLKFLPLSLAGLLFLASFGPWGASAVSTRSQLGELEQVLKDAGLFTDGKITPASTEDVSLEDRKRISSIVSYFVRSNKTGTLRAWLSSRDLHDVGYRTYDIIRVFGFEGVHRIECHENRCSTPPDIESSLSKNRLTASQANGTEIAFDLTPLVALSKELLLSESGEEMEFETEEEMAVETEKDGHLSRLIVESITLRKQDDTLVVIHIEGLLLLGRIEPGAQ